MFPVYSVTHLPGCSSLPALIFLIHCHLDTTIGSCDARSRHTTLIPGTTGAHDFPPAIPQYRRVRLEARDAFRTQFTLPGRLAVDTLESVLGCGDGGLGCLDGLRFGRSQ